jgi:hypothetical protein
VIINRHLRNRFSRSELVMLDSSAEEHQTDPNCRYHQSLNDQKESLKKEGQSKQDMTRVTRQRSSHCLIMESARGPLLDAVITPQLIRSWLLLGKARQTPGSHRPILTTSPNCNVSAELSHRRPWNQDVTIALKFCGGLPASPANFVSWEDHFPM